MVAETQHPRVDAGVVMALMKCCVCTSRCGGTHDSELMRLLQRRFQVRSAGAGEEEQKSDGTTELTVLHW